MQAKQVGLEAFDQVGVKEGVGWTVRLATTICKFKVMLLLAQSRHVTCSSTSRSKIINDGQTLDEESV